MSKKNARWRKLDNAAKLYSAASNKKDTRVFRFYCELKEEVNPKALQEALNQTIETFPTFLMVLRKGFFWHYLEPCNLRPIVKEEYNSIMYTLQINSVMLTRQTISMDLKHKIPSIAWNNKELLRGFLCGMFDGDGGISGNGIVLTFGEPSLDTQYPEDIQQALLLFGIRSTVERTSYCAHVRIRTRDNKLFKDRIGFINFDKQQSIDEHTSVKHGWKSERIRSAEITGNIMTMYDVINTESGKFMTEGYITHNSAAELLKRALIICKDFDLTLQVHDEIIVDGRVELPIDAISHIAPFHTPFKVKYLSRWE